MEIDETYVGGRWKGKGVKASKGNKAPVVSLVERNGRVRSIHVERVTAKNLRPIVNEHVDKWAQVMTDESLVYPYALKDHMGSHDAVAHAADEYVRIEGDRVIHTNTVEGYFSILKRGVYGTFHHVSKQHLHRYLSEFDFRYNARDVTDTERAENAVRKVVGKRLMYLHKPN